MMTDALTLALDLGGTKQLACLVQGTRILKRVEVASDTAGHPDDWLSRIADTVSDWGSNYTATGIAVSGQVHDGCWNTMNPAVLAVPDGYPLRARAAQIFGAPATVVNDAHAAAWGEYIFGAGQGQDMVFLTISTGVGGGVVLGGRLMTGRSGLVGNFGQTRDVTDIALARRVEDQISGVWFAQKTAQAGHPGSAKSVFSAASAGADWAETLIAKSAERAAQLCLNVQLTFDPDVIVIGGSIGLSDTYLPRVSAALAHANTRWCPVLRHAQLVADPGIIGVAHLARRMQNPT